MPGLYSKTLVVDGVTPVGVYEVLRRDAERMDPATFKAEWERFLSDAQAHL